MGQLGLVLCQHTVSGMQQARLQPCTVHAAYNVHKTFPPMHGIECSKQHHVLDTSCTLLVGCTQVGLLQRPLTDDMDHEGRAKAVQLLSQVCRQCCSRAVVLYDPAVDLGVSVQFHPVTAAHLQPSLLTHPATSSSSRL
jgi:hypothetical protein